MQYSDAVTVAKRIWDDDRIRREVAFMVNRLIGVPTDPSHPLSDIAYDALVREFKYEYESDISKDKALVLTVLKQMIGNAIIDAE